MPPIPAKSIPTYGAAAPAAIRKQVSAALAAYLGASASRDWQRACAYLARPTRLGIEPGGTRKSCVATYRIFSLSTPPGLRVGTFRSLAALRVKGNHAFAFFYDAHRRSYEMPMVREAGVWKVAQLVPFPLAFAGK